MTFHGGSSLVWGLGLVLGLTWAATAHAQIANESTLMEAFSGISRDTQWPPVDTIAVQFPTHHPQGMARVGERFYIASVEVRNRAEGEGAGHFFEVDPNGALRRHLTLADGPRYHPGGLDFDGTAFWLAVAEYRPDSSSVVYRVAKETFEAERVFRFDDHLGAFLYLPEREQFFGVSWGSRRFYRWDANTAGPYPVPRDPANPTRMINGSHYVDYQDLQRVPGTPYVVCSGVSRFQPQHDGVKPFRLGGIDAIDIRDGRPVHQVPIALYERPGLIMTRNPFWLEKHEAALRAYFMPADNQSTIHVFEAR